MGTNATGQRNQSWVDFAGVMLAIAGFFQMIFGAAVLSDSTFLINKILYGNMESWGWAYLITGLALLATAWFVFQRNKYAEVFGVVVAVISLFINASVIAYQPIWSAIVVIVDVLIIYGLVAHGDIRGMADRD
mgnify:CR=1 FL=1